MTALHITLNNLFRNTNVLSAEYKGALNAYSSNLLYPIINRISRGKAITSFMWIRTFMDWMRKNQKRPILPNAMMVDQVSMKRYEEAYKEATDALVVLKKLFKDPVSSWVFPRRTALYRSIDRKYEPLFIGKDVVYEDKGFTSTTIYLDTILQFKSKDDLKTKLYLLPGIEYKLFQIGDLSYNNSETEVLLNQSCVYFYIGALSLTSIKGSVIVHEFILLPSMEMYKNIGHLELEKMGKKFHQEYTDIKESVEMCERKIQMGTLKFHYSEELEYLLQRVISKPPPLIENAFSPTIYTEFELEAIKLQKILFKEKSAESMYRIFKNDDDTNEIYLFRKHIDYIQWILHLIYKKLLNFKLYNETMKLPFKNEAELESYLRGLLAQAKEIIIERDTMLQNKGGRSWLAN